MPADAEAGLWFARSLREEGPGAPASVTQHVVLSADFPPGSYVDLPAPAAPSGWRTVTHADADSGRVRSVQLSRPGTPHLWYAEVPEPSADPVATTLVAYSDDRRPEGTVVSEDESRLIGVRASQQVAAFRWWTASGLTHQVYVQPAARRLGVGTKLAQVAFAVQAVRRLPAVHGDGRRTDDGQAWLGGLAPHIAARIAPRSQHLPSMSPVVRN